MKRLLSFLLVLCLLCSLLPVTFAADEETQTVTLTAPINVTVKFYDTYGATGNLIEASNSFSTGSTRVYTYKVPNGTYSFKLSGTGYYTFTKNVYVLNSNLTYNIDPGKKTGKGFESSVAVERTDALQQNALPSETTTWPGYEHIFSTPAFTTDLGKHEFTSQTAMMDYLQTVEAACDDAYLYSLGTSPSYNYDIPMLIFTTTDLSSATLEEAAELVRGNGKVTVVHQAQIHGNEPAAGEGALAIAGALSRGDMTDYEGNNILDTLNILVIPRINPDGSHKFTRANVAQTKNMNRDYLALETTETTAIVRAYNLFLPEVGIDGHEWSTNNNYESGSMDDLKLWSSGSLNNDEALLNRAIIMMETVFDDAQRLGIRPYFYGANLTFGGKGSGSNGVGPYYYGLRGSIAFCVETPGIGIGKVNFERRVFTQYISAETLFKYVSANREAIQKQVADERVRIAEVGATYEESDLLTLLHDTKTYTKSYLRPTWNWNTGTITKPNAKSTPVISTSPTKTRTRPTAYLLHADTANLEQALALLDKHDVQYYKLTEDMVVPVRQYSGTALDATLNDTATVTFPAGSYLLPMNQSGGNVLAMLMEPDVTDTYGSDCYSTMVQTKTLTIDAICRYEGSLNIFTYLWDPNHTVEFRDTDETVLQKETVAHHESVTYNGKTPVKESDESYHYTFEGWTNGNELVDLSDIRMSQVLYPSFHAEAHVYGYELLANPDCENAGLFLRTCACGKSYKETISPLGHTAIPDSGIAPTCTQTGLTEGSHCAVCQAVIVVQEIIPATGHREVADPAVAPTCTETGLTEGSHCETCGEVLVARQTVDATGHDEAVHPGTAPTCTASGVSAYSYCRTCQALLSQQEILPRLGHDYAYTDLDNGTHKGTCIRCDRSRPAEAHTPDENGVCTLCGNGAPTGPIVDEAIQIYHTLNLASDIAITFAVPKTTLESYDSYYLECEIPKYEGNTLVGSTTAQVQPVVSGGYYYFTLTGITAVQMNDMVDAVLHMTKGEQEYISKTDSYSVASYAYKTMNESKDAKMLTLCADLLRYGAEAQSYKKYRTDALVDANMTETHRSYLSSTASLTFSETDSYLADLQNPTITWVGKTLDLGSKVGIKFVFNTTNYSGDISKLSIKVTYVNSQGETTTVSLTDAEAYGSTGEYYSFTFYGLLASELRTAIDVAVYEGETRLSETLRYSAETYASKTIGNALEPLTRALFAYSDSAKAYFTK